VSGHHHQHHHRGTGDDGLCIVEDLAFRIAGLVYDEVGGDQSQRPKEFL
jgi:hypothetical protein